MSNVTLNAEIKNARLIFIDFEYKQSNEKHPNLVCATLYNAKTRKFKDYWLYNSRTEKLRLADHIEHFKSRGYAFVAYNAVAECRCFLALGLDPVTYKWIDLMLEYRQLTNHYDKLGYGNQLTKSGKVIFTRNENQYTVSEWLFKRINCSKPLHNLAAACFKILGVNINPEFKSDTISLILETENYNAEHRAKIMKYCRSDVEVLPKLFRGIILEYRKWWSGIPRHRRLTKDFKLGEYVYRRGQYAALTSHMESRGYPVKRDWFNRFLSQVTQIYTDVKLDIMSQFSEYCPFAYKKIKKVQVLGFKMTEVQKWVHDKSGLVHKWPKTETGRLSIASDAWDKFYNFKHDFPRHNYAAQICRWNSFKKSMAGFSEKTTSEPKILKAYSEKDSRIRPYFNIYGASTSRSQPPSTYYLQLKSVWCRAMIYLENPKKFLCSIDYGSQEVLVQAVLSSDDNLYQSYISGDVYLSFAKLAGAVPPDGTKKTHAKERAVYKQAFLSIGYGVGAKSLALQITNATDMPCSVEKAEKLIDDFERVYHKYKSFLDRTKLGYGFTQSESSDPESDKLYFSKKPDGKGYLQLPCGWCVLGNSNSNKSIGNFMVQGSSASIMREAVRLCYIKKLPVIYTLHDALTCELENEAQIHDFQQCMKQAFVNIMQKTNPGNTWDNSIRLDTNVWGEYFRSSSLKSQNIKQDIVYVDERAKSSFDFYSKYFMNEAE